MDDMKEIVSIEQVQRLFLMLAIVLPILGVVGGALLGARRGNARRGALQGLLLGALGPVNLGLWMLYNGITDRLGLDSVKNLLVNLVLFVALGIAAGLIGGTIMRRNGSQADEPGTEASVEP